MANKENQSPLSSRPAFSRLSPNNKPALSSQRDHSACRNPDTPLKVRKTRENLRQHAVFADIPPPCVHAHCTKDHHATPISSSTTVVSNHQLPREQTPAPRADVYATEPAPLATPSSSSRMQRQKSVSRRMLSRVKQGIGNRSKSSHSVRPTESDTSLARRLSGRRKPSQEIDKRSHSFEIARASIDSGIDQTPASVSFVPSTVQRSFTGSTVSTNEALGEGSASNTPDYARQHGELASLRLSPIPSSSPPPNQTPRPPPQRELPPLPQSTPISLHVPCIELCVALSSSAVDLHSKHDIWVAMETTVRPMPTTLDTSGQTSTGTSTVVSARSHPIDDTEGSSTARNVCGSISSLRLCFKPVGGCSVREVIGQKTFKDLKIGQQCSLFIKVHVPRVRIRDSSVDPDPDSLLAELESMIGTLKMEILHLEARYRHCLLPSDNVVTVRHICKVKRPKTESRWSVVGLDATLGSSSDVHVALAQYLAATYSAAHAVDMLQRHIDNAAKDEPAVRQIRDSLMEKMVACDQHRGEDVNPSVIVTDSELDVVPSANPPPATNFTAPSTPAAREQPREMPSTPRTMERKPKLKEQGLLGRPVIAAPPVLSLAKTTISLSGSARPFSPEPCANDEANLERSDSARQLWRHIRRTSLSTKQLEELTTQASKGHLEPPDESVNELQRQALANKRSVGAETLRAWKWDEKLDQDYRPPEAPWM
ncbi:uncharacterized protein LTR77_000796 [Saxophila tyrrhenica]|uniref:Uncharacterized protein n=1 Tax=Saxophila tyrrhenica TaxID=1690608 RepID=A0AAV9PRX3_9PEZI|nr:hypothetical protein LTR77_000796 [Saxophila tyrrhenica]